jgi:hypothetical protein
MSNPTRWTHQQITRNAETQIKRLMQQASETAEGERAHVLRCMAHGVYISWRALTDGSPYDDDDRLRALTLTDIRQG